MSKIGRKPIDLGAVTVEISGQEVRYKGKKGVEVYLLPEELTARVEGNKLLLAFERQGKSRAFLRDINRIWGLHRALLASKIKGAEVEFTRALQINGLGFKAALAGSKLVLSLGFVHKIDFPLPVGVSVEIDKTGQNLTFKSADKELIGQVASKIRALRPPEPYKGTGIKYLNEIIVRKAGKAKAAA